MLDDFVSTRRLAHYSVCAVHDQLSERKTVSLRTVEYRVRVNLGKPVF